MRVMNSTGLGTAAWGTLLTGHFHLHIEPLANSVNVAIQLVPYPYQAYVPTIQRQKYFVEHRQIPHRGPGRRHQFSFSCLVMQSVQHLWRNSFPLETLHHLSLITTLPALWFNITLSMISFHNLSSYRSEVDEWFPKLFILLFKRKVKLPFL